MYQGNIVEQGVARADVLQHPQEELYQSPH